MARSRAALRVVTAGVDEFASVPRRLLLDTQTWLWWQAKDAKLGRRAHKLIQRAPEVRLSAVSVWEMSIKSALGKLKLPRDVDINRELAASGFLPLAIEIVHAEEVRRLPLHHGDPFDRMLIAQTRVEGYTVVTSDPQFASYGIPIVDATL